MSGKLGQGVAMNGKRFADHEVYFISSDDGPIKIGSTWDVRKRLSNLQTASPHKLKILATTGGGNFMEIHYHGRFKEHRIRGEWFARHPDVMAEIERLAKSGRR